MSRPKILFLAHLLPWPLDGGGQIKSFHTLRLLSERYDVSMVALIRSEDERVHLPHLEPFCKGGIATVLLKRNRFSNPYHALRALLRNESFLISRDRVPAVLDEMTGKVDVIHVDHLQMAQFIAPNQSAKVILDQHNVEHRIPKRIADTPGSNLMMRAYAAIEWKKLRDYEIAAMRRADKTITVSEEDRTEFLRLSPDLHGKIEAIPIGVDTDYFAVANRKKLSKVLLSIGTMYWPPNIDAILWFVSEVLPLIRRSVPESQLMVVGAKPTSEIMQLAERDPRIVVTGTVPDVRPYADDCGVFIVPLRSGSGMRVKILNALSMGLPVISTTVGAEGIGVTSGKDILLADTPQAFADAVVSLLNNPEQADRLATNGRALMEEQYGWNAVGKRLYSLYDEILELKTIA